MVFASTFTQPDPAIVVVGLALLLWLARLGFTYFAASHWRWTIADLLWLTVCVGVTLSYFLLLR
jgi:hypothetical protein